jgi:hypothetical protein
MPLIIKEFKMIALHYLKTWFLLDLVSVLPLGVALGGASSG